MEILLSASFTLQEIAISIFYQFSTVNEVFQKELVREISFQLFFQMDHFFIIFINFSQIIKNLDKDL